MPECSAEIELPVAEAMLVIGHGTREPQGVEQFHRVVEQLREAAVPRVVAPAFLELCAPSIPEAIGQLARAGNKRVVAAPLLLFAAGHAERDIPALLADARQAYPQIEFRQARCLECHPAIVELSALRFSQAIEANESRADAAGADTLLLFVGRGSREPAANAEMARFARLRFEATPVGWVEVCFTALTEPSLDRGLEIAAALPFRRVVVQPHLLFDGELLRRIQERVAVARRDHRALEWLVTDSLGPHQLLVDSVLELATTTPAR